MLLESLKALILAGDQALQETCGLPALAHEINLVRQGSLSFPAVAELNIKGGPVQVVHLGCNDDLAARLAGPVPGAAEASGFETLTNLYLKHLLPNLDARNPRGTARHLSAEPLDLVSRGLRSVGIILETGAGQLFILSEVPSRMEMEIAKGSDYLRAMEATYLPRDWGNRSKIEGRLALENFATFIRKVECDVAFEIPGTGGVRHVHHGLLLENGTLDGVRGLKFCSDLGEPAAAGMQPGELVAASVGVDDRSLAFAMKFLGTGTQALVDVAEIPCLFFEPPETVSVSQRRLAFRIPVMGGIRVELHQGSSSRKASPWGDHVEREVPLVIGVLGDLSFSGARVLVDQPTSETLLEINRRVTCELYLPDQSEPITVLGAVRRMTSRLVDRNERQHEIGLEFLIAQDGDRGSLERIRQYVLTQQRTRLAKRISLAGLPA